MRTDAARNRERIIEAARALVAAEGPDVSMDAIAAASGVAVGTLYRHHPTKAALVRAVIEDSIGRFADVADAAAEAVAAGADPFEALAGVVRGFADQHAQDRALKSAAAGLGATVPLDVEDWPQGSAAHRAGAAVQRIVTAAVAAGAVRPDLTLADLTMLLGGVPDEAGQRERYVEIVVAGIAAR